MSRTSRHVARRSSVHPLMPGIFAVTVVVIACSTGGATVSPTTGPTVAPTAFGGPTPAPSLPASADPSATAAATIQPSAQPPNASLAVDGGDAVTGQLGSYTWNGGGSDSPWLPGAPIAVGAGERLVLTLGEGVIASDWTARRVVAGTIDGSGAVGLGDGQGPVAFPAPPPGEWSVQVTVRFAGDLGSAAYYWQVTVR